MGVGFLDLICAVAGLVQCVYGWLFSLGGFCGVGCCLVFGFIGLVIC